MHHKLKILAVLLTLTVMIFALCSCSNEPASSQSTPSSTQTSSEVTSSSSAQSSSVSSSSVSSSTAASSSESTVIPVETVTITLPADKLSVYVGDTFELTPTVDPADKTVEYTSSDKTVCTVSPDGKAKAESVGEAVITVSYKDVSASCTVMVEKTPDPVPVDSDEGRDLPYVVKVNKLKNVVTVYKQDDAGMYTVPVKASVCSGGPSTPLGSFNISDKYIWGWLVGDVKGQYCTRIEGDYLFHSVPYDDYDKGTLQTEEYNKLGTTCSHGCIRLPVDMCKWIYENCEAGTTVVIYEDEYAGPLTPPAAIKLPEGCRWDPTDPDPSNPWVYGNPSVKCPETVTVTVGDTFDALGICEAFDSAGYDAKEFVTAEGDVDVTKPGDYTVKYSLTDCVGKTASAECVVTIEEKAD